VVHVTAKDILLAVIIPLILAEIGPWCGWLAARLLPWAARLRYGDTDRAAVRLEEWSGDLNDIPGQLTKLAYAAGQVLAGLAASAHRETKKEVLGDLTGLAVTSSAGQGAITAPERPALNDALRGLSDRHREIVLRYAKDLSESQIASAMATARWTLDHVTAPRTSQVNPKTRPGTCGQVQELG